MRILAVGRVPNTSDLGLERAGVTTDQRGYIIVDDQLQTNVLHAGASANASGWRRNAPVTKLKEARRILQD